MRDPGGSKEDPTRLAERLSTPRSAAVAGIVFAVILAVVIVVIHTSVASLSGEPSSWVNSPSGRGSVTLAINLIPFAGIAFLWFVGVIRTRLGDLEDRLFATVFLGSGLLFVAMLFTAAAGVGSLLTLTADGQEVDVGTERLVGLLTSGLLGAFGMRMAAVFTLSVTTLGLRTGLVPRWLVAVGYVATLVLFLTPPITVWAQLLFPLWVALLSGHILFANYRHASDRGATWG